jgi:hypothetical protein
MRVAVAAVAACGGCKLLDDDEPPTTAGGTDGDTNTEDRSCVELVEAACDPGMSVWMNYSEGASNAVLIDDPYATVGVGPGAWLVRVDSETDYVGTYHDDGEGCEFACAWCETGQLMCHGGLTDQGVQGCVMCFPDGLPDVGDQCAAVQAACVEGREDEGLDETGGGTTEAIGEYDCTTWQPAEGVQRGRDGTITVDAALVDEVFLYQGEPLASCDDTRFRRRSDGYFEISKLGSHGLLVAMGLARGDALLAVSGNPMNNFDAVMEAARMFAVDTSFTVTIGRGDERFDMDVSVR